MSLRDFIKVTCFLIAILFPPKLYSQERGEVNIGTIPSGKTLVVKYDVVINNPLPEGVTSISSQATIKGANFNEVYTDDPATEAPSDATIAEVLLNSPPTLGGVLANQTVNDNASILPFAAVSIVDVDLPAQMVTVTVGLDAAEKGSFTTLSSFSNEGSGAYKFFGTAAAATEAIRGLVFTPTANRITPVSTETTTFIITVDDGNGGTVSEVGTVVASSVDDLTVLAGGAVDQPVNDHATIAPFSAISVTDPDIQPLTVTITISDGANRGDLTPTSSCGWIRSVIGQNILYVRLFDATGNNSRAVEAAIRTLVFQPKNNVLTPDLTETTNFTIKVAQSLDAEGNLLAVSTLTTSVNDAPVIASGGGGVTASLTVTENITSVTSVLATDQDVNQIISYSISGGSDASKFKIDANTGTLSFITAPDFESPADANADNTYEVIVRASDGTDFAQQTLSVMVSDLNDVKPIITADQSFRIDENSEDGSSVGTVIASDGDAMGTTFSDWKIIAGNTGNAFTINASTGKLTVNTAGELDKELTSAYTLTLTVSDGLNTSAIGTVSIAINDINDVAPVITDNQSFRIDENSVNGTLIGTVIASDGDATGTTFSDWKIIAGNIGSAFAINASTGELTVNAGAVLNYELTSGYKLTLTVSDGLNTSATETVSINIRDLNDVGPEIAAGQTFSVDENTAGGTYLGIVTASDGDATPTVFQQWTITAGNTDSTFAINASTGELRVNQNGGLDRELVSSYTLSLTVSDGINTSAVETVTVNLNDLNDISPLIVADQTFSIEENALNGTSLGTIRANDGDVTTTTFIDWAIIEGNTNNVFAVNASTGELIVNKSAELNAEILGSYTLILIVRDGVNTSLTEAITIRVKDENDIPPVITEGQIFVIDENSEAGTVVGTVTASDADLSATTFRHWTITAGDPAHAFSIHSETGTISVNAKVLDYEIKNRYELTLQVSDGVQLSATAQVMIMINDCPETPASISFIPGTLYENQAMGALAGKLSSTSGDPRAIFTYSLVSGAGDADNERFLIEGDEIKTAVSLNFEEKPAYTVRVRATTQYGFSFEKELVIPIGNVNEIPTLDAIADLVICFTSSQQTIPLGGLSAGEDAGQNVSVSVISNNEKLFNQLSIADNELKFRLSGEASGTALITVKVSDNGGTDHGGVDSFSRTFNISVNPLSLITITSDRGTSLAKGLEANLTASGGLSYQWMDADGMIRGQNTATLTIRPAHTTTYRVRATTASGCSSEHEITIEVNDNFRVMEANNILTPNGDGVNEKFEIKDLDMYPNNEVKIYDRAGRMIYSKKNYTNEWNGTLNGMPLAEDTYFYVVDFGPGVSPIKGFITIVQD